MSPATTNPWLHSPRTVKASSVSAAATTMNPAVASTRGVNRP